MDLDYDLKIEIPNTLGFEAFLLIQQEDMVIEIPGLDDPVRVFLGHTTTSEAGQGLLVFTPKRSPIWKPAHRPLFRSRASLVNFAGFDVGPYARTRIDLTACGWDVMITPVRDEMLSYPPQLQTDEHKITHELELERTDKTSFSDKELLKFLEKLSLFFSFCHGGWIAIALAVGLDQDGVVDLAEWGIGRIGTPSKPDSFLDSHHLELAVELFPLFMDKLSDEDVAEAFSNMVYWLRRSDTDNAGPDGGIILLQAALERLSWHRVVRELGGLSEKGFSDLTAADQIRLLLTNLEIPKAVPNELTELVKFAKAYGLDGPEA